MRKPINIAVSVLLGGVLVWGQPARQSVADDKKDQTSEAAFIAFFSPIYNALTLPLYENEEYLARENREINRVQIAYDGAVRALQRGDASAFKYHTQFIDRESSQTEHFRAARVAKNLRATLPPQFVPYFAYIRADGTVAADPDEFIRAQLKRVEDLAADGSDGSDGAGGQD